MQNISLECSQELGINMQLGSCGNETPERHGEGEDMISNLPELIIGHILSFLSTKQAIATSVISKRWKYFWTLVTKLSFYDRECSYRSCNSSYNLTNLFSCFVSSALNHLNSQIIQEFDLVIHEICDPYYISQWLYTVLQRRVKKINVYSLKPCIISSSPLFECPTLEKLVLTMTRCYCSNIKVPSFVSLPPLTVLKLTGITFTYYASADKLKELTLHFPLLREYKTHDCTWSDVKSFTLEAPLLESVETFYGDCDSTPEIVKFCASYITNLSFRGDVSSSQTILLDDDQHITSTSILLFNKNNYSLEEVWIFIRRLLSLSNNAKYLKLYYGAHQQHLARVEHYLDGIPAFRMMGHLHLGPVTGDVLLDFLLKSPCLKTLVLQMADDDAELDNYAIVPNCFLSTLKVVKFAKYFDREHELRFAKFVLENAKVLEKVSFSFHKQHPWTEVEEAKEKLSLIKISCSPVTGIFCLELG